MTRLTDREIDAVLKAKLHGSPQATDLLIAEAKRLQGQALRRGLASLFAALGDTALARRLHRAYVCRKTRAALENLDDGVLRDIGLTRGEIARQARTCAERVVPAR
jgi:uncharacterized protein YjiS (DUF1127 family)